MIIHLIRHTTPLVEAGICYGQADLDVATSFSDEKDQVLAKLKDHYPVVYSSPLQRCAKLASCIPSDVLLTDNHLLEYDFGDWELRPWSEFDDDVSQHWMDNFIDQATPNGESMRAMHERVSLFWNQILSEEHEAIAIVTHSGVLRLIHGLILETPLQLIFRLQFGFGAILEINSNANSDSYTIKHL